MNAPQPVGRLSPDEVRTVLSAAIMAPSLHNSQPWRFRCTPTLIELYADTSRAVPVADPDHRELVLACGAALLNLRLAIRSLGVYPDVRLCPDPGRPDLLATVRPEASHPPNPVELRLAEAIRRRHTNRRPFADIAIPEPTRNELRRAAERERSWLAILPTNQLAALRRLVHQAHQRQQDDPDFRTEWAHWMGRPDSSRDGVPARSAGLLPEAQDEWVLRDFSAGRARARLEGKDFERAPLIAVVGSFFDSSLARLQAGQAMQRVLLTATDVGLDASFLSQVVEVPDARKQLRQLIGGGLWPQTVLRLGHGTAVSSTRRRKLEEVLEPPVGSVWIPA
jgi:nitroreductase